MKLVRVTKENIYEAAAVQNELFPEENGRANFEASLREESRSTQRTAMFQNRTAIRMITHP